MGLYPVVDVALYPVVGAALYPVVGAGLYPVVDVALYPVIGVAPGKVSVPGYPKVIKIDTGILTKDETSGTTIRNLYCPFSYKYDSPTETF